MPSGFGVPIVPGDREGWQGRVLRARELRRTGHVADGIDLLAPVLAAQPDGPDARLEMVELRRAAGDVAAAAALARGLPSGASMRTDLLAAILTGRPVPETVRAMGAVPVPFVLIGDVLPADQHGRLMAQIVDATTAFETPKLVKGAANLPDRSVRDAWVIDDPAAAMVAPVKERVAAILEGALPRLGIPGFRTDWVEAQVTIHGNHHFYNAHRDDEPDPNSPVFARTVSYVYYLHRRPKAFGGGQLRLYDSDPDAGLFDPAAFTQVEPANNTLILFPSWAYHEVRPVTLASADPFDGRITVNGWVHRVTGTVGPGDPAAM